MIRYTMSTPKFDLVFDFEEAILPQLSAPDVKVTLIKKAKVDRNPRYAEDEVRLEAHFSREDLGKMTTNLLRLL